jgi:hypothetical protein
MTVPDCLGRGRYLCAATRATERQPAACGPQGRGIPYRLTVRNAVTPVWFMVADYFAAALRLYAQRIDRALSSDAVTVRPIFSIDRGPHA